MVKIPGFHWVQFLPRKLSFCKRAVQPKKGEKEEK